VIGGDASNDVPCAARASSTSDQVERWAKGVDIIVHSTIHPVRGGPEQRFPPPSFYRQSTVPILRYGKAGGSEVPSCSHILPVTRSGATQPLERSGGP